MPHRWDEVADLRKQQIENGLDLTFSKVFIPYYRALICQLRPTRILEVGGGTGHLARALSGIAQKYVMIEPSRGMYDVAREVLAGSGVEIYKCPAENFHYDVEFDLVLSHMCIQAVENLSSFLGAIASQISATGCVLLALPHPVFYNDYKAFFPHGEFRYIEERSKSISFSITLDPTQRIDGVPYHHRPLSRYVSEFAAAGLCLTRLDEIYPPDSVQKLYGQPWKDPRYLVLGGRRACEK